MAGKFERKSFSEINLNDPFFDSLKADYPGSATSTSFIKWFRKKTDQGERALVFEDVEYVWHETKRFGGVLKRDYLAYYREREIAIAYQLGEITLYEKPKKLRDLGLDYVPQSFAYI